MDNTIINDNSWFDISLLDSGEYLQRLVYFVLKHVEFHKDGVGDNGKGNIVEQHLFMYLVGLFQLVILDQSIQHRVVEHFIQLLFVIILHIIINIDGFGSLFAFEQSFHEGRVGYEVGIHILYFPLDYLLIHFLHQLVVLAH